ncbi:MAG: ATP-binding protein [Acidobacteriota bacterium]|jgi:predicted AAA+ superfamily ATPase|nr:ATP-binding protein [Acidobacteriota bacterium]
MNYIERTISGLVERSLLRGKSLFLFGARQTGKTTLANRLNPQLTISFVQDDVRQRYERKPSLLGGEVETLAVRSGESLPLVVLDEVQKVPAVTDVVQDLIDRGKAKFLLTGSSARKLRRYARINLLPGRVVVLQLDPFSLSEWRDGTLEDRLLDGSLPGIVSVESADDRDLDLTAYVTTYLEEEIRQEAIVRRLDHFARFLELAASESGQIVNLSRLASEIGISHTTVAGYYQILEDCLIAERVEPLTASATRKKLTRSCRYLFFDSGVRRAAAREGRRQPYARWGALFEQFIGLELLRFIHARGRRDRLRFWRDSDGPEVDWVLDFNGCYAPIEVKWTDSPTAADARHLRCFMSEYPTTGQGFVVCRAPHPLKLSDQITAVPWQNFLDELPWP